MPIPLRADYDDARVRLAARESRDAEQTRRLLALAVIYDGATRSEAASIGGMTVQIVRDWVVKLNTRGPEALVDYKGPAPSASVLSRSDLISLRQRIRSQGHSPGQDGDPHVPVLISLTASSAIL